MKFEIKNFQTVRSSKYGHLIIGNVTIWYEPLNVSLQPGKFGRHRHSGSGDLMVLDCHVIFEKYAAKVSSNFMGESCSG